MAAFTCVHGSNKYLRTTSTYYFHACLLITGSVEGICKWKWEGVLTGQLKQDRMSSSAYYKLFLYSQTLYMIQLMLGACFNVSSFLLEIDRVLQNSTELTLSFSNYAEQIGCLVNIFCNNMDFCLFSGKALHFGRKRQRHQEIASCSALPHRHIYKTKECRIYYVSINLPNPSYILLGNTHGFLKIANFVLFTFQGNE